MSKESNETSDLAKGEIVAKIEFNGELTQRLNVDHASIRSSENGTVLVAWAQAPGKKLGPADFLQALIHVKALQPMGPEYSHLPAGVYMALVSNGCNPLEKGAQGGPGVMGYYVHNDPEEAVQGILEGVRGDAWKASTEDVAGGADTDGDGNVLVLWRPMH